MEAAIWTSHGRAASSRVVPEFRAPASPRVRQSRLRLAPDRRKAYSSPPRSADSCPGRAVTASTRTALGSESSMKARAMLGSGAVMVATGCSYTVHVSGACRPPADAVGQLRSILLVTRETVMQPLWRSGGEAD